MRIADGDDGRTRAWLTVKHGLDSRSRLEFEYEIPAENARTLLDEVCRGTRIDKQRFALDHAGYRWDVDRFAADNAPLIVAEIELPTPDAPFARPPWLGEEVTEDRRLGNVALAAHPLARWPEDEREALLLRADTAQLARTQGDTTRC